VCLLDLSPSVRLCDRRRVRLFDDPSPSVCLCGRRRMRLCDLITLVGSDICLSFPLSDFPVSTPKRAAGTKTKTIPLSKGIGIDVANNNINNSAVRGSQV